MTRNPTHVRPLRRALALTVVLTLAPLTACSAGSLGSSDDSSDGGTTITWLTGVDEAAQADAQAVVAAFEDANPDITVELDGKPGGADGDNLVKTRLQTGSMPDVFDYNSGSLFQQIAPAKNLAPLTADASVAAVDESFVPQVSVGQDVYGVPYGTAFGGGFMYNRKVFEQLGLQVPTTWDDYLTVSDAIKASAIAPVIQTYGETWTAQLFVLGDFHNVAAAEPNWAEDYTANKAKYGTDPVAMAGFEHQQEIHDRGYENADYASAKVPDGMRMLAEGTGAMYPITSNQVTTLAQAAPESLADIAREFGLVARTARDIDSALDQVSIGTPHAVAILGSLYLAGQVLLANDEVPT